MHYTLGGNFSLLKQVQLPEVHSDTLLIKVQEAARYSEVTTAFSLCEVSSFGLKIRGKCFGNVLFLYFP